MDLVGRLKLYFEQLGLQNSQIADMAGIPRPTLSQLLTGRNKKVSNELIEKLHAAFPTLNIAWLMFGEGDMLVKQNIKTSEPQNSLFLDDFSAFNTDIEPSEGLSPSRENHSENRSKKNKPTPISPNQLLESAMVEPSRRVQSIMVFYTDNSFEVFEPVRKPESE